MNALCVCVSVCVCMYVARAIDALFISASTDGQFYCQQRRALRAMADNGGTVYQYYFTYAPPTWIDVDMLGVYHTLELE
jgi:carboxylesterase type B